MNKTVEQKVADTILQEGFKVKVGLKEYTATPITYGTLIRISALISTLPAISEDETVFTGALKHGKHADKLAEIVALCILNKRDTQARYQWRFLRKQLIEPGVRELKEEILYNCTISEVSGLVRLIFSRMELSDFFGVMVSLSGVNLIAETATTASGQPSEE